jgi:hypothetical protein
MVLNATFNNMPVIFWRSVLLAGEIGAPGENHRPASHLHIYHKVVSTTTRHELDLTTLVVIDTNCIGRCKSNHHMMTTTTASIVGFNIDCHDDMYYVVIEQMFLRLIDDKLIIKKEG